MEPMIQETSQFKVGASPYYKSIEPTAGGGASALPLRPVLAGHPRVIRKMKLKMKARIEKWKKSVFRLER
jgi:hypothetical protein